MSTITLPPHVHAHISRASCERLTELSAWIDEVRRQVEMVCYGKAGLDPDFNWHSARVELNKLLSEQPRFVADALHLVPAEPWTLAAFGLPGSNGSAAWLLFVEQLRKDALAYLELLEPLVTARSASIEVANVSPENAATLMGNVFRLDSEVWRIDYRDEGESGKFTDRADSVFRHVARLLAEPNRRLRSLEFYQPGMRAIPHMGRDANSGDEEIGQLEMDLTRLVNEIKEAEAARDTETASKLRDKFDKLTKNVGSEKKARSRGHKNRCGTLSPDQKADQALRVGFVRLHERLKEKNMPKLAAHLKEYIDNSGCIWCYIPPPGTSPWIVTRLNEKSTN